VTIDAAANKSGGPLISKPGGKIATYVIGTDEELMIARHTAAMLAQQARKDSVLQLQKH
jgi:acetate kinase